MFNESYAQFYDLLNSDKPYQKEIEFVYDWAGKPKRVLDIGAGTGSYWKYYPTNVHILGIEKSVDMARYSGPLSQTRDIICADVQEYKWYGSPKKYDAMTALFDVINYIPNHDWWERLPLKKGGCFVFDLWSKEKADKEGFRETTKSVDGNMRRIVPVSYDGKTVQLDIELDNGWSKYKERHTMYLYGEEDILKFCGKKFVVEEIKPTESWQLWYKLRKK